MSDDKKRNIINIIFGLIMLFMWWLSGYDFNTRGRTTAEEFYFICGSIVVVYTALPFLIRVDNSSRKDIK